MKRAPTLIAIAGLAASLSACAADTEGYPSLARRPAERVNGELPVCGLGDMANAGTLTPPPGPPAPPLPPPPPADLNGRLAALVDQAREFHANFLAERPRAESLVLAGAGTPVASDSWSVAAIALASLESARSNTMVPLADLDHLYTATRVEGGDAEAIAAARSQVDAWVAEEDRVLTALRGRFGS